VEAWTVGFAFLGVLDLAALAIARLIAASLATDG